MNRNLKIGTPSDDGEYACDGLPLPATPDALPVTYVDVVAYAQYGTYTSTFTRPMPVPVTHLVPNREVAGLLQSAATFAPGNPASQRPHSAASSRAPLSDSFIARWREDRPTRPLTLESPVPLTELSTEERRHAGFEDLRRHVAELLLRDMHTMIPARTSVLPSTIGHGNSLFNMTARVIELFQIVTILAYDPTSLRQHGKDMCFLHDARGFHPGTVSGVGK